MARHTRVAILCHRYLEAGHPLVREISDVLHVVEKGHGVVIAAEQEDPTVELREPIESACASYHDAAVLLDAMLSALGYVTRYVHDDPSALGVAKDVEPDLALVDIGLPVMDGYELARRFSEHPRLRRTRLIALTGYGQQQDRQRSTEAGSWRTSSSPWTSISSAPPSSRSPRAAAGRS